jgi:hypothetical protein
MSGRTRIHIERISVRVRGVSAPTARAAADGLGISVGMHLAAAGVEPAELGDISVGRLEVGRRATPSEIRTAVASQVARVIARRTRGKAV